MTSTETPAAGTVTRTGSALRLSAETLAAIRRSEYQTARFGVSANAGQTWRDEATGEDVVLLGRRTRSWVVGTAPTGVAGIRLVDLDTFDETFTYMTCDHDKACCPSHRTHTSPHMGCVLR